MVSSKLDKQNESEMRERANQSNIGFIIAVFNSAKKGWDAAQPDDERKRRR